MNKKLLVFAQVFVDILVFFFSYLIWIYIRSLVGKPYSAVNIAGIKAFLPYMLIAYLFLFVVYRLYDVDEIDFYETFLGIFFSCFIIFILGFALPFFIRAFAVPRTLILFAFPTQLLFLFICHLVVRKVYLVILPPIDVLVITKNLSEGKTISDYFKNHLPKIRDVEVLLINGENFENILQEKVPLFDLFAIGDSHSTSEKSKLVEFFVYRNKPVYLLPGIYGLLLLNSRVDIIGELTVFEINLVNMSGFDRIVKRIFDFIFSITALVVFSPIMLSVSIAILFDSGRPVFYLQDRVGVNGRIFKTVKFRTMLKDVEKYTGPVLSSENDPRVTKVGRFLRKTGLDETPQFINVLRGEMSVVGPRPERPELISKISKDVSNFDMRLKVKPGITGFAQLYGKYDTPFDQKLIMDLLYVKARYTIFSDIYIIMNTVRLFLSPKKRK